MKIRIGTRGSPLALAQAREVQSKLAAAHDLPRDDLPIVEIRTSGDRIQDRPLSEVGGKGLFTKEIEESLYAGAIDIAVHSMKDLETVMPPGLEIAAVLEREDVRDAFISLKFGALAELPSGTIVGTSSLRRRAQLRNRRPDLDVVEFRGNVQTRLKKLQAGIADATFLACAGLNRLGQSERITRPLPTSEMLPAVGQGAIAVQMRSGEPAVAAALAPLDHQPSRICVAAERAFLGELDGSCRTPIAGLAEWNGAVIDFRGEILTVDGARRYETAFTCTAETAEAQARAAAMTLRAEAGPDYPAKAGA
jgi:hydroxymethylbilane synthase